MDPTVQAALIAGGSTAVVGVVGFWSTVRATGKQIQGAQEARLWNERAAVYIDVLAALGPWVLGYYAGPGHPPEPDWKTLIPRVFAFGSKAVVDVFGRMPTGARDESPDLSSYVEIIELIREELQGKGAGEVDL